MHSQLVARAGRAPNAQRSGRRGFCGRLGGWAPHWPATRAPRRRQPVPGTWSLEPASAACSALHTRLPALFALVASAPGQLAVSSSTPGPLCLTSACRPAACTSAPRLWSSTGQAWHEVEPCCTSAHRQQYYTINPKYDPSVEPSIKSEPPPSQEHLDDSKPIAVFCHAATSSSHSFLYQVRAKVARTIPLWTRELTQSRTMPGVTNPSSPILA